MKEGLGEEDTDIEGERLNPPLRLPLLEKLRVRLTPPDRVTLRDPVAVVVYVDTFPEVPVGAATVYVPVLSVGEAEAEGVTVKSAGVSVQESEVEGVMEGLGVKELEVVKVPGPPFLLCAPPVTEVEEDLEGEEEVLGEEL